MSEAIVKSKIGSIGEWERIYHFRYFPLVQKLTNGGLNVEAVHCGNGCDGCPHIKSLPSRNYFCLLCFMETGQVLELGSGKDVEGKGCDGRFQANRISPKKKKQLLGKFRLMLLQKAREVDDFWAARGLKTRRKCCGNCDVLEPIFNDTYNGEKIRTCYGYCEDAVRKVGGRLADKDKFAKRHIAHVCDEWREVVPKSDHLTQAEFVKILEEIKRPKIKKLVNVLKKHQLMEAGKEALEVR